MNSLFHSDILRSQTIEFKVDFTTQENLIQNQTIDSKNLEEDNTSNLDEVNTLDNWYIQIDKIALKAPIQEGTSQKILEDYVAHFEESSKNLGNICLAAHNRGYKNNYFANLKKLKEGDIINYYYNGNVRTYTVSKQIIVEDTDWSYLENTEENTLTLITCVENEPSYRRCIQATEDTNN